MDLVTLFFLVQKAAQTAVLSQWAAFVPPSPAQPARPALSSVAPKCGQDAFEPNDRRTDAKPLVARTADAIVCAHDTDWFYFEAVKGETYRVALFYDRGQVPERPTVFAPRRHVAVGTGYVGQGELGVSFLARRSGRHRIRIEHRGDEAVPYLLLVSVGALEER